MKVFLFLLLPICSFGQNKIFFMQNQSTAASVLGEQYSICAYSLRLVNNNYAGNAIKVRRSSDNTEQDIGFVSGSLDTSALKIFVGSSNGYVSKWYDQSSLGNDAIQTTLTAQPRIVNAGTIDRENSKPTLFFNGTSMYLTITARPFTGLKAFTVLAVYNFQTASGYENIFSQSDAGSVNNILEIRRNTTNDRMEYVANSISIAGSISINSLQKSLGLFCVTNPGISGTATAYLNGAFDATIKGQPISTKNAPCNIGARNNSSLYYGGTIQEIIAYKEYKLSARTSLESNVNSYYSIY